MEEGQSQPGGVHLQLKRLARAGWRSSLAPYTRRRPGSIRRGGM